MDNTKTQKRKGREGSEEGNKRLKASDVVMMDYTDDSESLVVAAKQPCQGL